MTLRNRMGAVAVAAVAVTVLAVAVTVYVAVRSELRGQVDTALAERAQPFVMIAAPSIAATAIAARARHGNQGPATTLARVRTGLPRLPTCPSAARPVSSRSSPPAVA